MYDMLALYEAKDVQDAVRLRLEHPDAQIIAGGTDVLVQMREGKRAGKALISIQKCDEMRGISIDEEENIRIVSHIASIAGIADEGIFPASTLGKPFPTLSEARGEEMLAAIAKARADGDSVGGVVECAVLGLPAGLGDALFDGVESRLSAALFGIPAVKGVEFGAGFAAAALRGSENNDAFVLRGGRAMTETNRCGGILGGITTGAPLVFRTAFKPTPSIARRQRTVDLAAMRETTIEIAGRHDPCIVPRAVPCVEAAAAVVLYDILCSERGRKP